MQGPAQASNVSLSALYLLVGVIKFLGERAHLDVDLILQDLGKTPRETSVLLGVNANWFGSLWHHFRFARAACSSRTTPLATPPESFGPICLPGLPSENTAPPLA